MADFKKGDIVRLKSGGPALTVGAVGTHVECHYFNVDQKSFHVVTFPPEILITTTESDIYPNDFMAVKSHTSIR